MRTEVSCSSTAVGPKSSTIASRKSEEPERTSSAGYAFNLPIYQFTNLPIYQFTQLSEHILHSIEQIPFVLRVVASPRTRLEFFLRQHLRELLDQLSLLARQLFRCLHLNGREQVASSAAVDVRHP